MKAVVRSMLPLLVFAGARIDAQQLDPSIAPPALVVSDSATAEEGRRAGIADASERSVADRGIYGFIGGILIGFSLPILLPQGDPAGAIATGAGLVIVETSGRAHMGPGPDVRAHGEAFRSAYSKSYNQTLVSRRKKAARIGGGVGILAGIGLLVSLLSSYAD
ncbi:MAG TPA: hypothetical protein VM166_06930 [Gemmatimonadaceae bacterium]|nr:hypothetical protein [Gemmatimonadaceae bacterium]